MVADDAGAAHLTQPYNQYQRKPTKLAKAMCLLMTLVAFYGIAVASGSVLFVAAIYSGLLGDISILFYRGVAILAAIAPVLFVILVAMLRLPWRSGILAGRDAVVATILTIALNLTGFVLGPVTVDRSISVFMLSHLAAARTPLTARDLELAFSKQYVCEWDQIGRRLKEQMASGNLEQTPEGYRLTAQGQSFMRTARAMSSVFGGDRRFVEADPPGAGPKAEAQNFSCQRSR